MKERKEISFGVEDGLRRAWRDGFVKSWLPDAIKTINPFAVRYFTA
jgi:hypothetical protein